MASVGRRRGIAAAAIALVQVSVGVGLLGRAVVGQGFRLLAAGFWSLSQNCRLRTASPFAGCAPSHFLHGCMEDLRF
jgi:hypothetical protein